MSIPRLSMGFKFASRTKKKIQKSVRFRFSTGTSGSKTAQKIFYCQDAPTTNLKNKDNFFRLVAVIVRAVFREFLGLDFSN
jgi:hypothetical protein